MCIINSVMVSKKNSPDKSKTDWIPFCKKSLWGLHFSPSFWIPEGTSDASPQVFLQV